MSLSQHGIAYLVGNGWHVRGLIQIRVLLTMSLGVLPYICHFLKICELLRGILGPMGPVNIIWILKK